MCNSSEPALPSNSGAPDPVASCSYSSFERAFRSVALRSVILPLPPAFLEYLNEDGVFLGAGSEALPARSGTRVYDLDDEDAYRDWSSSESEGGESAGEVAATDERRQRGRSSAGGASSSSSSDCGSSSAAPAPDSTPWAVRFPELHASMCAAIDSLGGRVVPRLNWSCPTDAAWVNPNGTLDCDNADQVVLMLKSSDRVGHDLELLQQRLRAPAGTSGSTSSGGDISTSGPAATLVQPVLVLRKWYDLRPEREFRVFVRGSRLVGACQRDVSQHFPQLHGPDALPPIRAAIRRFHAQHIARHFPLSEYVVDLYVATNLTTKLIDFGCASSGTSPLLFSWEELGLGGGGESGVSGGNRQAAGPGSSGGRGEEGGAPAVGGGSSSGSSSSDSGEEDGGDGSWELRVVAPGGGMQAGVRAACGMPYDMLDMTESLALMQRMQQGQQGQ
ncbi:hypothetical protein FOA52_014965 [Chlamydomonas sp. UWO 241]|nr:hypothetical protein FOA52_014965 [Chlamydomonas sp. UWO 241]